MTKHQKEIIALMLNGTGRVSAGTFNDLCGSARTVRAMFRDSYVSGDDLPAVYVTVTDEGRKAFRVWNGK
jgi:hypothetical protein